MTRRTSPRRTQASYIPEAQCVRFDFLTQISADLTRIGTDFLELATQRPTAKVDVISRRSLTEICGHLRQIRANLRQRKDPSRAIAAD
ncbi:MAG: hypothetical protein EAZ43_04765 [Betaproteobacteria bacterium]|nr:MAG: hypothetical protein EAZ43_04765 [Betaproteobacteria bacterium]